MSKDTLGRGTMRGDESKRSNMFHYFCIEDRIPRNHPLREIKKHTETALHSLSPWFNTLYSDEGRPSVPPETLLKAQLLMALYTVRSDRMFCERLNFDLLFRWFLDMDMEQPPFDHSTFSKNRLRLLEQETAQKFLQAVVNIAREHALLSDEHFTIDGTLIEAWASMKSFRRRDGSDRQQGKDDDNDPGNPSVDFHGEKRTNDTHASTTDAAARLYRKSKGTGAQLAYCGSALMENRNGLIVDATVSSATGTAERDDSLMLLRREKQRHQRQGRPLPRTVGADKNFCTKAFVAAVRATGLLPHIARKKCTTPGLDGRTTRHATFSVSQRIRKMIEEAFGWTKTVGGIRKVRVRGIPKVAGVALLNFAAYDLLRISRLVATSSG
jgi:transposase